MLLRDLKEIKDGRIIMKGSFIKDSRIILKDGEPNYYDMVVAVSQSSNNVKGNKEYAQRIIESKMKSSGVLFDQTKFDQAYSDFRKAPASRAAFYKNPEDSKSTKDQIAELETQKEQAKKMGYGTDAYDAAIANLQKDASRSEQAYDEGYEAALQGKPFTANPYKDVSRSGYADLRESWDDGHRNGQKEVARRVFKKDSKTRDGGPGSGQKGHTTPDPTTHQERRKERANLELYFKNAVKRGNREEAQKISRRLAHINSLSLKDSYDGIDWLTLDPLTEKGKEILASMKEQYGDEKGEQIFYASKNAGKITGVDSTKDTDIIINISDNPNEEEQAFQSQHYNGYNIKQLKETGEFDIYDLGGAIIGHTATLELAKIFIDNKGNAIIGQTE